MSLSINTASESVKSAALAQLGSKVANLVFQLGIQAVLARLLTPDEYGTVAILTVFTALFTVLSDAGLSVAIIRYQDLTKDDYRRLFGFSFILGISLSLVFIFVSYVISIIYGNTEYIPLGSLLSLTVFCNSLNMVPNGLLQKEKKFKLIALRLVFTTVVVGVAVIGFAYLGFGCYAIVLNSVLTSFFVLIWNVSTLHIRPLFGGFVPILRRVGRFSIYQFGSSAISWVATNADSLIAGKMFGSEALGYYNRAYSLYGYPNSILASSITSTLVPYLAPNQNNHDVLYASFSKIIKRVSALAMFCTVEMSICSVEIISFLYGSAWAPAAPLLQVLSIAIYSQGMNQAHAPLLSATGRTDLLLLSTTVNTLITFALTVTGALCGSVQMLANCVAAAYSIEIILPIFFCMKGCLNRRVTPYLLKLLPDLAAGAITLVLLEGFGALSSTPFVSLLIKAVFVAFVFLVSRVVLSAFGKLLVEIRSRWQH